MKKFALVSMFMILTTHLPMLTPSKLVPADWLTSLEYGKKSLQLVLRLYQVQKSNADRPLRKAVDKPPCQATICPSQSLVSPV
jgi:hypothetical protein